MVREQQEFELLLNKMLTIAQKETTMAFDKATPYSVNSSYYGNRQFDTLENALAYAKKDATKQMEDIAVYKAVQLVKAPLPTNIEIEVLS